MEEASKRSGIGSGASESALEIWADSDAAACSSSLPELAPFGTPLTGSLPITVYILWRRCRGMSPIFKVIIKKIRKFVSI